MRFGIGLLRLAVARAPAFLSFVSCPPCGLCPCLLVSLPCFSPRLFSCHCRPVQVPTATSALHAAAPWLACGCCLLLLLLALLLLSLLFVAGLAASAGCCCCCRLLLLLVAVAAVVFLSLLFLLLVIVLAVGVVVGAAVAPFLVLFLSFSCFLSPCFPLFCLPSLSPCPARCLCGCLSCLFSLPCSLRLCLSLSLYSLTLTSTP